MQFVLHLCLLLFTVLCTTLTASLLQIIRRPVDIAKIQQRIDDEKYDDMNAMQKDFMLLCENTQKYNEDGSLIFEDSIVLQSVFTNARERLEQVDFFTCDLLKFCILNLIYF